MRPAVFHLFVAYKIAVRPSLEVKEQTLDLFFRRASFFNFLTHTKHIIMIRPLFPHPISLFIVVYYLLLLQNIVEVEAAASCVNVINLSEDIQPACLSEAIQHHTLDRNLLS